MIIRTEQTENEWIFTGLVVLICLYLFVRLLRIRENNARVDADKLRQAQRLAEIPGEMAKIYRNKKPQ